MDGVPCACLSSYDISALFPSVPVEPGLGIIKVVLEKDNILKERTVLLVKDIILLLEFFLHNTYFLPGLILQVGGGIHHGVPSQPHSG